MMSRVSKSLLTLLLAGVVIIAHAQKTNEQSLNAAPQNLQELVSKPVLWRGTLGTEQIQLSLRPKKGEDGLDGSYFIFGQGSQILLAGEVDHDDLMMEESHDGKDVSGEWEGSFSNGVLSGTWSTLDGSISKPFVLNVEMAGNGKAIVKP